MSNKGRNKSRKVFFSLIITLLMVLSFGGGVYFGNSTYIKEKIADKEADSIVKVINLYSKVESKLFPKDIDFNIFWQTWDDLKENYVDRNKLSDSKLFYGALKGMVAAAGDPYTVFMEPKIAKEFTDDLAGTFEGIGAEIGVKKQGLMVIAPLPDMPAEKAGLKAGDRILAIDGKITQNMSVDEAVSRIRGPKDTEVILTIMRDNNEKPQDITIKRGKIIVKSVRTNLRDDDILVIKITSFNEDTVTLFNKAVRQALDTDPKGIILDLRNNPGGFFDAAIEVASEWVDDNVVVSEKTADGSINEHLSRGRPRLKPFPTVVLVNQGSASASEIVSGALKDYGLAVIVGKTTFGKGTVQNLTELPDASQLKITIAKWLTPNGTSINKEGIEPDIDVDYSADDFNSNKDPQMDKAVEILTSNKPINDFISTSSPETGANEVMQTSDSTTTKATTTTE